MPQFERISLRHFRDAAGQDIFDQQDILFWGVCCGYCGDQPGMPVNFLAGKMCSLNDQERADVIEFVITQLGSVKRTLQTEKYFAILDHRRNAAGRRSGD